jgi:hypothetical protein
MSGRDDSPRKTLVQPQMSVFNRCYKPIGVDLAPIEIAL